MDLEGCEMTKDEALQLALKALGSNRRTHHYCEDTWYSCPKHEDGCANDSEGDECNCGADKVNAGIDQAITAINEALETKDEPVSDKLERLLWEFIDLKAMHPNHNPDPRTWPHVFAYAPKPNHLVAWGMEKDGVILDVICPEEHEREEGEYTIPLYTTPQREYEQGFIDGMQKQMQSSVDKAVNSMGKREWVGLTDEEKAQFVVAYYPSNWDRKTAVSLMSDYEKYLKERNT